MKIPLEQYYLARSAVFQKFLQKFSRLTLSLKAVFYLVLDFTEANNLIKFVLEYLSRNFFGRDAVESRK